MASWKKYLLGFALVLLLVLLLPSAIALLGIILSPIISIGAFVAILFIFTVVLAYKNKIGR